jgi:putative membrane protein
MFEIKSSLQGLGSFFTYLGASASLTFLFLLVYTWITPYREIKLIRRGNLAAAVSLSGSLIGFVLPLASAIFHSVGLIDMLLWALISLSVQLFAYWIVSLVLPDLADDIKKEKTAQALFLASISVAFGLLNAVCLSW